MQFQLHTIFAWIIVSWTLVLSAVCRPIPQFVNNESNDRMQLMCRYTSWPGVCSTEVQVLSVVLTNITMHYRLADLVVKTSASGAEDPGFESRLQRDFSRSSHTRDFKIATPLATLPGVGYYRVSVGTGWPGVSILWLDEVEDLICNFYLSVTACVKYVFVDPSLRYTCMLLGR